jgi:hypothetical protein
MLSVASFFVNLSIIIPSVIILNVIILNVISLNVISLNAISLNAECHNIRLVWNYIAVGNTLAYYDSETITSEKSFTV